MEGYRKGWRDIKKVDGIKRRLMGYKEGWKGYKKRWRDLKKVDGI